MSVSETLISNHALTRMRQRSIPRIAIDLLLSLGKRQFTGHGCIIYHFDKQAKKRLTRAVGVSSQQSSHISRTYLVASVDESTIITVGYRTKRIHR